MYPRHRTHHYVLWICLALTLGAGISFALTEAGNAFVSSLWKETRTLTFNAPKEPGGETSASTNSSSPYTRLGGTAIAATVPNATTGKFIHADLEAMSLTLFEDGAVVETLPILSKGKPGSPWETPAGLYQIRTKEETHFSSIGEVWMPKSMQFFGNFFIHGWPHYGDGSPVADGYSGGCIRLATEDAARVFAFASIGTVIGVHTNVERTASEDPGHYYTRSNAPKPPMLSAKSYLVADIDTREVLLEKNMDATHPIASVSKLMTSLVSLEVVNQFLVTTVSKRAVDTEGFSGLLTVGEKISTGNLLYPLLLSSSNDAAEAIAEHQGRSAFINQMNAKARSIGMHQTSFEDPSGLSVDNVSTARDLFVLARHLHRSKRHVLDLTLQKSKSVPAVGYARANTWLNNNYFITRGGEGYMGGKTGFTDEARHTLVAVFKLPLGEFEDRTIAIILLGSENGEADARELLAYLKAHVFYKTGTNIAETAPASKQEVAATNLGAAVHEILRGVSGEVEYRRVQDVAGVETPVVP